MAAIGVGHARSTGSWALYTAERGAFACGSDGRSRVFCLRYGPLRHVHSGGARLLVMV